MQWLVGHVMELANREHHGLFTSFSLEIFRGIMMALGFLFGGGVGSEVHGLEMYRTHSVMRDLYEQISTWTGMTVGQILEEELPVLLACS